MGPYDVQDVLDALRAADVRAILDGGWGVDAFLGDRPGHIETSTSSSRALTLPEPSRRWRVAASRRTHQRRRASRPARCCADDDRCVDVHVVVMDGGGSGWQELGDGAWGHYPAEGVTGAGTIGRRWVSCVTTALQLRHHLGYPRREHDLHDVRALADRFGIAVPPGWRRGHVTPRSQRSQ
jgi:lincosamide nucleotidyltransferase A/C/D/E